MKEFLKKITKKEWFIIVAFLIGYIFGITSPNQNIKVIFENIDTIYLIGLNILYLLFIFLIFKIIKKSYKYFLVKDDSRKQLIIASLKNFFFGYFLGTITLIGNVFILVLL